jgi:vitamin B12 transporter
LIITGTTVNNAGSPSYFSAQDLDNSTDKSNYSIDLNYRGTNKTDAGHWLIRAFLGRDENIWSDPVASNPSGWDDGIDSKNTTEQRGAQAQYTVTLGGAAVTAGMDWLDYKVENSQSPQRSSYLNPAAFLLGRTTFFERLTINAGLRQDWYQVDMKEPAGNTEDQHHLTPQIGMALALMPGFKLRGQYAEAFMMPSADQLGADYQAFTGPIRGNPDLDPENSTTWEGGLDYDGGAFRASLGYFATKYKDKIVTDYLADGSSSWKNLGRADIKGIEVQAGYDLGVPLGLSWEVRPTLSATFLTEYTDRTTNEDLLYTGDTVLAAGMVVGDGQGSFFRANLRYSGNSKVQDWESGVYPAPVVELGSSTVVDVGAVWRFYESDRYGGWSVRGEVLNLFDEEYAHVKGYPMPGRSMFLGLRWEFLWN